MAAFAGRLAAFFVVAGQCLRGAERVLGLGPAGGREHAALDEERGAAQRGGGVAGGVWFQEYGRVVPAAAGAQPPNGAVEGVIPLDRSGCCWWHRCGCRSWHLGRYRVRGPKGIR
ncbi:hypothetical protein GCM10010211_07230 [Streptomyces albospinus]|uniref:Secreted protein n=1 Tax=Streptomyces albospinus TaxID=285515 RepID=A0ABQ2UNU5_9ACTN|nr:hypothetical protein GCM10010211_07230 [Streptomyces albospinus]